MMVNRITGILLMCLGLLGFVTVADDLRHVGEVIGVSSIVLAGCLLLASSLETRLIPSIVARSGAIGIFLGMILGAGLDDMLIGVGIGLSAGMVTGLFVTRKKRGTSDRVS